MSHHLAQLISAAEADTCSPELRQEVVATILQVWAHRWYYPGRRPLDDFRSVFAALDRLDDPSPWRFFRLFDAGTPGPDPTGTGSALVETAADLERVARDALLAILWLAAQDAKKHDDGWLEAADRAFLNAESEVVNRIWQIRRSRSQRRRSGRLAAQDDGHDKDSPADALMTQTHLDSPADTTPGDPDDSAPTIGASAGAETPTGSGPTEPHPVTADASVALTPTPPEYAALDPEDLEPFVSEFPDERDPTSAESLADRLRTTADQLHKIADSLERAESP
jgi:hypothetical protein